MWTNYFEYSNADARTICFRYLSFLLEKYINKVSYCKLTDRASASVSLNILAGAGDVVDLAKFFLISSLITVQNLSAAVSHAMPCGAYIEDCCEGDWAYLQSSSPYGELPGPTQCIIENRLNTSTFCYSLLQASSEWADSALLYLTCILNTITVGLHQHWPIRIYQEGPPISSHQSTYSPIQQHHTRYTPWQDRQNLGTIGPAHLLGGKMAEYRNTILLHGSYLCYHTALVILSEPIRA